MISIIILNWNGYSDTIECLKSLCKSNFDDYFVVIGDNGSSDESMSLLSHEIPKICNHFFVCGEDNLGKIDIVKRSIILYSLNQNYGFAKGNNKLIKFAQRFRPENYLLLNNDTEVKNDALEKLCLFNKKYPKFQILTPLIHYYFDKKLIWNAGGKLFWGFRKYYYADKKESFIKEREYISISFITGCALFIPSRLVDNNGIFIERFFHGEEDFDFSYRMKNKNIKMACVLNSHIYHKVNASTQNQSSIGKIYIYYLNRYINMSFHLPSVSYMLWRCINNIYVMRILRKLGYSNDDGKIFIKKINQRCRCYNSVTRDMFYNALEAKNIVDL